MIHLFFNSAKQKNMALVIIDSKLTDGNKQLSTDTLRAAARKVNYT